MSKPTLYSYNDNSQPKNLLESLQESILRRLSKTPLSRDEPVVYEFTNDRALLHQYYRLREVMYRRVFKTDKFVGEEDVHDKLSHVLIARRGRLCIGGVRLTIREPDEDFMLPMESSGFRLRNAFADVPLRKFRHGEISRFAVMDDDEESLEVMSALSQLIIEKCGNSGLGFVFFKSTLPMARNWRKVLHTRCGQKNVRICTEVKVPEMPIHPEVTWYITQVTLVKAEDTLADYDKITRSIESLVH